MRKHRFDSSQPRGFVVFMPLKRELGLTVGGIFARKSVISTYIFSQNYSQWRTGSTRWPWYISEEVGTISLHEMVKVRGIIWELTSYK